MRATLRLGEKEGERWGQKDRKNKYNAYVFHGYIACVHQLVKENWLARISSTKTKLVLRGILILAKKIMAYV
jgi:hypothetical protein